MDALFAIFEFVGYGIIGLMVLLGLLIVAAILFGKRVHKKWEYEAEFRGADSREFGEFDIELSQIEKEEPQHTVKAKLRLRHPSLTEHQTVQVLLDKRLVLEGMVETPGRIFLKRTLGEGDVGAVHAGQMCHIRCGGTELAAEPLRPD
jgi:hypothetical protein